METEDRPQRGTDQEPGADDDGGARQPALPFSGGPGEPPINYALTARARRAVAPESLPDLAVLPGGPPPESDEDGAFDPHDSRPARARALRRAGRGIDEVAAILGAEPETVARWTDGVEPARRRPTPRPVRTPDPIARADARDSASALLTDTDHLGPTTAGLIAGLAAVAGATVTVTLPDPGLAPIVVRWFADRAAQGTDAVRVLVAAGPTVARDLTAQRWARACGLPSDQVSHAPLREAGEPDEVRLTVRVRDAQVAADVLGWRDALGQLADPPDGGADGREAG